MQVWRITRAAHADLSGSGGQQFTGRWHRKGAAIVYTSTHVSLTILESRLHLARLPANRVVMQIEVPDPVPAIEMLIGRLPQDWSELENVTQEAGTSWLEGRVSAACSVPSVVIPSERNVLLNPAHSNAWQLHVLSVEAFTFDSPRFNE